MKKLPELFKNNREWADSIHRAQPEFFKRLAAVQTPRYLWIGCSDSRVPANQICGLDPGEMFVHRNIANLVVHTDFSMLSVLQYAVDVLKVTDVIVCGHYGCGGVRAALSSATNGLIDNWLRNIKDVYACHRDRFSDPTLDQDTRVNRLCELNVTAQVANVCYTSIVQGAWKRQQALNVHGWIYSLDDGYLHDLDMCVSSLEHLPKIYRMD